MVYNKRDTCYHVFVAARKPIRRNNKRGNPKGSQVVVVFWLVFVIVIISVFMLNTEVIKRNFNLFRTRLTTPAGAEEELLDEDEEPSVVVREQPPAAVERQTPPPAAVATERETRPQTQTEPQKPAEQRPAEQRPAEQRPAEQPARTQPQTQTPTQPQPQTPPPAQTRDRAIYFTQIDKDGQILQSRVTRRISVSDSPMQDALNVMLAGPSADEINRNILNMIPQGTRILSATVRGNTAYINFSEDFLFNTFGVEGSVAQLRQIVWTVTEFQNVKEVQILVEGRRLDYLGEGIWIGSPISRQSF